MAKQQEIIIKKSKDVRINEIINYISQAPRKKEDILNDMGIKSDSWQKYHGQIVRILKTEGKRLKLSNKEYSIISLNDDDPVDSSNNDNQVVQYSSNRTVKEVLVLHALNECSSRYLKGSANSKEIAEEIYYDRDYGPEKNFETSVKNIIDCNKTRIKGLLQRGYVIRDNKGIGTNYKLTDKSPVYIKLDPILFNDLKDCIRNSGHSYAFPDIIFGVDNLLSAMIEDDKYNVDGFYKNSGLWVNHNEYISKFLKKINKNDYKNYKQEITYKNVGEKTNKDSQFVFGIGLVVYACDKDRLYLIGKKQGANNYLILNTERITKISDTNIINDMYGSDEFEKIYEEMFSVSVEKPFDILVEFDNALNIPDKLRRLKSIRPNAIVDIPKNKESKIIYRENNVRGLEDVAKWLRSFGRSARVIKPEVLRDRMKDSIIKTLKEYEEVLGDE